jgi:3-oxoacyl-[acyl-carrier-protein] synthase II
MGALTPIGNNIPAYLDGLLNGRCGAGPITLFDVSQFKTRFACEIKGFVADDFMDKREVRKLDRFAVLAMVSADEAVTASGLLPDNFNPDRVGVIFSSGIGGMNTLEQEVETFILGNGIPRYNPYLIPKMISDIAAGHISMKYGFRGINYSIVSACASSTHAIMAAFDYIRWGRNDIIVAGGSEAAINKIGVGGFSAMKALSTRNDDPLTASRPFDAARDGFVLGEGAGSLVLEELEHALRRGATIYGEVVGAGATADAYHLTAPHPEGLGAANVMKTALEDAGMSPSDIDYINVHGTSTPLGDLAEIKAIEKVFGEDAYRLSISSTKSMTGHLLGAAGAIEAIAGVLAINHGFIPPTINHFEDDPAFDSRLDLSFNVARKKEVNAFLSNTFGFGGHNASVIIRKYQG